ncbi:MAG: peptidoglycan DD-metalloendopeptidase family protein [Patescibacteria group bacterium]
MKKSLQKIISALFLVLLLPFNMQSAGVANAASSTQEISSSTKSHVSSTIDLLRETLQRQIEERAKELEQVNRELTTTQKNLTETKTDRLSLQKELDRLQYTTNQLKLNIQSDEITVQKLNLEIQTLTFDVQDIQTSVKEKRLAIIELLRALQKMDQANFLVILLRSDSLADGVAEAQALNDLNSKLTVDVENLKRFQEQLSVKLKEFDQKRAQTNRHQRDLENRKVIIQDQKNERQNLLVVTKNKESVYEKQVTELQKRQQEIADEIESIDAELRSKIDLSLLPVAKPGILGLPVEGVAMITQRYGATDFAKSAYRGKLHNGIDFRAVVGSPIIAAEAGIVVGVGDQDAYCYRGAYGKYIAINHGNNLTTLYAHLSRQVVKKGQKVERGELVGYSGRTGYATGPHLHFTVFAQPTFYMGQSRTCGLMPFGGDLNPIGYLNLEVPAAATVGATSTPSSTTSR